MASSSSGPLVAQTEANEHMEAFIYTALEPLRKEMAALAASAEEEDAVSAVLVSLEGSKAFNEAITNILDFDIALDLLKTIANGQSANEDWRIGTASCFEGHALEKRLAEDAGYECDSCCQDIPTGSRLYDCRPCDYTMCQKCFYRKWPTKRDRELRGILRDTMAARYDPLVAAALPG